MNNVLKLSKKIVVTFDLNISIETNSFGQILLHQRSFGEIDGSRAVYRKSLNSRGSQMKRSRLIDGFSVYLQYQSICNITIL